MLTSSDIVRRSVYYVLLITGMTALVVVLALFNQGLFASIATHNVQIIMIASFVLLLAIVFQYKQAGIALENAKLYRVLQEKQSLLDRDLRMARSVQQGLIPEKVPGIPGYAIAARCLPAESVGGDFYDFIEKPNEVSIVLGDVSGHGVSSALVMALTNGMINEIGRKLSSPAQVLAEVNAHIQRYLANNINFVTAFYARLEAGSRRLSFSKAGHLPALLFRSNGTKPEMLDGEGILLGVFSDAQFTEGQVDLQPGDKVIFYTDGLVELRDPAGEWFGDDRLIALIEKNKARPAQQLLDLIFEQANSFSTLQRDDQTMVVLEAL